LTFVRGSLEEPAMTQTAQLPVPTSLVTAREGFLPRRREKLSDGRKRGKNRGG
jgi:hypothetical protein